jgi:hypothetical protein
MDPSYGITGKLLIWFFAIVAIFYGTILLLYLNFQQVVRISERIVNKNYTIADNSKKILENLLNMEENEKKFRLLEKKDYLDFFTKARQEFEISLKRILSLGTLGVTISPQWQAVYDAYQHYLQPDDARSAEVRDADVTSGIWIPEKVINEWRSRKPCGN